jgi:Na+-transporting NADH:ubiquinone oxidoreductase subunit NqrD
VGVKLTVSNYFNFFVVVVDWMKQTIFYDFSKEMSVYKSGNVKEIITVL